MDDSLVIVSSELLNVALYLITGLDLVVASHNLGVRGRNALVVATGATLAVRGDALLLRLRGRVVLRRGALGAVVHAAVLLGLGLVLALALGVMAGGTLNVNIRDTALVSGERLVLVRRLGVLCDDVPGVEEAGDIAEDGEENVDEGVGAADAALDPYWQRREEDGEEAEEDVCVAHGDGCANGVVLAGVVRMKSISAQW